MSKKHRRKNFNLNSSSEATQAVSSTLSQVSNAVAVKDSSVYAVHKEEYNNISSDLIKVLVINGLFLAAVIALYYINKSNPFLDSWYHWLF